MEKIIKAWADYLKGRDEKTKKMAEQRLAICKTCPVRTLFICDPTKHIMVDGRKVRGCGCVLAPKASSPEQHCPAGKW